MGQTNRNGERLNLRISDRNSIDDMRILAHSQGQTLAAWTKSLMTRELSKSEAQPIFERQLLVSILSTQKLVEQSHSQSEIKQANETAKRYIEKVERHAR